MRVCQQNIVRTSTPNALVADRHQKGLHASKSLPGTTGAAQQQPVLMQLDVCNTFGDLQVTCMCVVTERVQLPLCPYYVHIVGVKTLID